MSNYIVIEIETSATLTDLANTANQSTKQYESINTVIDALSKRIAGASSGTVKIVTKDTTTTISTSGTDSASNTFTL